MWASKSIQSINSFKSLVAKTGRALLTMNPVTWRDDGSHLTVDVLFKRSLQKSAESVRKENDLPVHFSSKQGFLTAELVQNNLNWAKNSQIARRRNLRFETLTIADLLKCKNKDSYSYHSTCITYRSLSSASFFAQTKRQSLNKYPNIHQFWLKLTKRAKLVFLALEPETIVI